MSSLEQNLDRQLEQLQTAGASQIYKEKISGSTRHRPQLEEVLRYLRKGNQLIVTSMDRLARSLVDLHTIVEDLVGSVAEFERAIIKERQAEGIAWAKARGVYKRRVKGSPTAKLRRCGSGWPMVYPRQRWHADSGSDGPPCTSTSRGALGDPPPLTTIFSFQTRLEMSA